MKTDGPFLTLSMVVKHYQEKYLEQVLRGIKEQIGFAVFFVEADSGIEMIRRCMSAVAYQIIKLPEGVEEDEKLRPFQWQYTLETHPQWILFLDGDEKFEDTALEYIPHMLREEGVYAYNFRLYDMWDQEHYREDSMWQSHLVYRPFMVRYNPEFNYVFQSGANTGRIPDNLLELTNKSLTLRIQKLALSDEAYRIQCYKQKVLGDPLGKKQSMLQYVSLIDNAPNLVAWQ